MSRSPFAPAEPDWAASFRASCRALFVAAETIDAYLASHDEATVRSCTELFEYEIARRDRERRAKLLRAARFPEDKSVDGFDFSNVAFPDGWGLAEMRTLRFVDAAEDLVFFGKTGRGKTHVAIGLGMLAVSAGMPVRYYQVADLVTRLRRAASEGTLDKVYSEVTRASMVILDEFGFVPCGVEGARLLFQVISLCYERRSIVFTTNIEFSKWGTVLADDKLAAAIVDRVVHHGRLVTFGGPSYRLANSLMMGTGTAAAGAAAAAGGDRL